MPRKGQTKSKRKERWSSEQHDDMDEYKLKRQKNNEAVKRSRVKSRMRYMEVMQKTHLIKAENEKLVERIKVLSGELAFLKELIMAHASNCDMKAKVENVDLDALLGDTKFND